GFPVPSGTGSPPQAGHTSPHRRKAGNPKAPHRAAAPRRLSVPRVSALFPKASGTRPKKVLSAWTGPPLRLLSPVAASAVSFHPTGQTPEIGRRRYRTMLSGTEDLPTPPACP